MARFYYIESYETAAGKSYIAQRLGLEFPIKTKADFPTQERTKKLIEEDNNVVFTCTSGFDVEQDIEHYDIALEHAKNAGSVLTILTIASGDVTL